MSAVHKKLDEEKHPARMITGKDTQYKMFWIENCTGFGGVGNTSCKEVSRKGHRCGSSQ